MAVAYLVLVRPNAPVKLLQKAIVVLLIALCFATLGVTIYLDEHFYRTRPRYSQPEEGRVYPQWIHHGTQVYLTRLERAPFDYSWYVFAVCMISAYLLNRRWQVIGHS